MIKVVEENNKLEFDIEVLSRPKCTGEDIEPKITIFYPTEESIQKYDKLRVNKMSENVFQSAKVYVIDFHFSAKSKTDIAEKKKELDNYFDFLRLDLEERHSSKRNPASKVKCEVFLRKH